MAPKRRAGLTLSQAENWLDWLENNGTPSQRGVGPDGKHSVCPQQDLVLLPLLSLADLEGLLLRSGFTTGSPSL